jgi:hypothetical protein
VDQGERKKATLLKSTRIANQENHKKKEYLSTTTPNVNALKYSMKR